jgi:glucose 1-dehydrogenase
MRAVAVFPASHEIRVVDHPVPALRAPNDVRVRVLEVGVCGTDREITSFQYGTPPDGEDHLVIGHESLTEVVETGEAVSGFTQGDLAVLMVRRPCPHADCAACRAGRQDFCFTGDFVERGIKGRHGFMTEQVVDDARFLVPVPAALREVGVLTEPLTIAEKALEQVWQVQQRLPWGLPGSQGAAGYRHRAVVLGAGPVGLLGAMVLVAAGFETWVYSRASGPANKADLAATIGARYVAAETTSLDDLASQVGNVDLIYEATGASRLAFDALHVLGPNAVFVFTGVPGRRGPVEVDTDAVMRRLVLDNQVVFGTVNAGRGAYEAAVRDLGVFMERFPAAVRGLLTGRFPIESFQEPLAGRSAGIKDVIAIA